MVEVTSIVISVIALVASTASAILNAVLNLWTDYIKRRRTARELQSKYAGILSRVARELILRINDIVKLSATKCIGESVEHNDAWIPYTSFLVGQYLFWAYNSHSEASTLLSSKRTDELIVCLERIKKTFTADYGDDAACKPFKLWHGQYLAIGEVMADKGKDDNDSSKKACIGYAEFRHKWEQTTFHSWFQSIENDMNEIARAKDDQIHHPQVPDQRLRLLQHS